jgi:cytochrome c-type biogenesis protein CcmH
MTLFAVLATLLVVVVAAFLLPPLWFGRRPDNAVTERREANLAIFRDQLAELEKEKGEGSLTNPDFEQAQRELQHRLLQEVNEDPAVAQQSRAPSRKAALALLVAVPLAAVGVYHQLGTPAALDPQARVARPQVTPQQIEAMVSKLAERLKANPDDPKGWVMLGRSYKAMGRLTEAAEAYSKGEALVRQDAGLLTEYAETLAMAGSTGFVGKPRELVEAALKLDPENGHALLLAGAAAMQAGQRAEALRHWEKLLPMVEPGTEIEAMLKNGIEKLRQPAK